jgi:hypothetical protein
MLAVPPPTVTLPTSVVRRRFYRRGAYADVPEELLDAVAPRTFLDWAEKKPTGRAVSYSFVREKLGLPNP